MPKCPHCGEIYERGQEFCFACGQSVRIRRRRGQAPMNAVIFIVAGVAIAGAVVAIILMSSGASRRSAAEREKAELQRVQDSVRDANRAVRETLRARNQDDATQSLVTELGQIEARFNSIKRDVVKGSPTPAQQRIVAQFGSEFGHARQLGTLLQTLPPERQDSVKVVLRGLQRKLRTMTSDLARAPKK